MKFTFYGHSNFLIETQGHRLLFDPFFTGNKLAKGIDPDAVEADFILISHAHGDHIGDAVPIAKRTGAKCISNYEIVNWLAAQGISNGHPINHGGKWKFDFGTAKYVNAIHTSSFPDGSYGGNPGGFIVENEADKFYFAGDTALTYDMKIWGEQHHLDLAILPIGDNFTMGYEDAAICADWVRVKKVIGVHFDTFGYIEIDHDAARKAFAERGVELIIPEVGETIEL